MAHFEPRGLGWLPDRPDFRDSSPMSPDIERYFKRMRGPGGGPVELAPQVDLREYFVDVYDQGALDASCAHACAGLVEYFQRRSTGRLLRPARLFLHQNALRLAGATAAAGVDLRTTLKALVLAGAPPERLWPYEPARILQTPDPFLYTFAEPYRSLRYFRLDSRQSTPLETLRLVKSFLAAGFPVAFGFSVPDSMVDGGDIPYRPTFDSIIGGQAVLAVGYDDRWLRGSRGALLIRNSWGRGWGEEGYGWLPYAYVEERLSADFWTVVCKEWIKSGEFELPDLSAARPTTSN